MTIDDIRAFAANDPEAFKKMLLEDGWRWNNHGVAEHFKTKYEAMYRQTLRDQFAIAALPACVDYISHAEAAERAYKIADAMLAARGEGA